MLKLYYSEIGSPTVSCANKYKTKHEPSLVCRRARTHDHDLQNSKGACQDWCCDGGLLVAGHVGL